jgi:hypothetical protein
MESFLVSEDSWKQRLPCFVTEIPSRKGTDLFDLIFGERFGRSPGYFRAEAVEKLGEDGEFVVHDRIEIELFLF